MPLTLAFLLMACPSKPPEGVKLSCLGRHSVWAPRWTYYSDDLRGGWHPDHGHWAFQKRVGGFWFALDIKPGWKVRDDFPSVFDLTGFPKFKAVMGNVIHKGVVTGGGGFYSIAEVKGGMRMTTGSKIGDTIEWGCGDQTGFQYPFALSENLHLHISVRYPTAFDLTNLKMMGGFYKDLENNVAWTYDTDVGTDLHFVTKDSSGPTTSNLGPITAGKWIEFWGCMGSDSCFFARGDTEEVVKHTTNLTTEPLTYYISLETLEKAAKSVDIGHFIVMQSIEH